MANVAESGQSGDPVWVTVEGERASALQLLDETGHRNGSKYGPLSDSPRVGNGPADDSAERNLPQIAELTSVEAAAPLGGSSAPDAAKRQSPASLETDAAASVTTEVETPRVPPVESPGVEFGPSMRCMIDVADWSGVSGWIWKPRAPMERISLELLDGEVSLTTTVADRYRPDLEKAGIGDGRCGFWIPLSQTLLPYARHVLHLRTADSKDELPSFPLVLTRGQAGFDSTVMHFLLDNIDAETTRAQKPEELRPVIANILSLLDQTLTRYFELEAEREAFGVIDALEPSDFSQQLELLLESLQRNYPPIVIDPDPNPVISIIIPVYNKFEFTYRCVKSVEETGAQIPYEVIIVDDCSRDETLLAKLVFSGNIRLVRNSANCGFVHSCNRGFKAARGEYVVFLNNDTIVKPRWLDELYETLRRDPKIGIAGSKLLFPDGSLQECGGIIWRLGDGWNWGRDQDANDPRYCYLRDTDYVSGAALFIKASLFEQAGGFDEHFAPGYYEDTDLCFKVRQLGYRTVVQPASEVIHFEGATSGTSVTGSGMKRFQAINHRKFFERWKDVLADHRFNGETPVLEVERGVRQRALFVDDSVPEPDKDAGSNAALQHIQSLQRLGYKVTFVPGDNMAKLDPYTLELQRLGVECLYHPFYFSIEEVFRKQPIPFDLVYLHRYSNASKYAGMVRQHFPRARVLYNVADLHFLRLKRQAKIDDDDALRARAEVIRRLELGAMSFVDCVIVHSTVEADLLRRAIPGIEVQMIPWTIEVRDLPSGTAPQPRIAFVGGYRHPPNVDAAKWAVQRLMPQLRASVPGIELLLVGSNMPAEVSALAAKDVIPLGYVPSLDSVFDRIRLTVAPLRYGAGLKGKVLDSLAAGVPCVMTSVAAEGLNLPNDLSSLVVDEPEQFVSRIEAICRDDAEYQRLRGAGMAYIASHYSAERIDAMLRQACRLDA
jgi:GT2 family glycosyltransferase/glycosyltransferase involved in cell wall biosynthesis